MNNQTEEKFLAALTEIRNWIRAASHGPVKTLIEAALPEMKLRKAYQMLDGTASMENVRIACKISPNALIDLTNRWVAMGLMEVNDEKKRVRLFNLADFGLIDDDRTSSGGHNERQATKKR